MLLTQNGSNDPQQLLVLGPQIDYCLVSFEGSALQLSVGVNPRLITFNYTHISTIATFNYTHISSTINAMSAI